MTWDFWTFVFGLVGALSVLTPPMFWLAKRIRSLSVFSDPRFSHFLDDWFGEPARPGFAGREGVPERLSKVETMTKQLGPNGGSHLADKITKLAQERSSDAATLARIEGFISGLGAGAGGTTISTVVATPDHAPAAP